MSIAEQDSYKIAELLADRADPTTRYRFAEKQSVYTSASGNFSRTSGPVRFETSSMKSHMKLFSQAWIEIPISVHGASTGITNETDFVAIRQSALSLINNISVKCNGVQCVSDQDVWHHNNLKLLLEKSSGFVNGQAYDEIGFAPETHNSIAAGDCYRCVATAAGAGIPTAGARIDNLNYNAGLRKRAEWLAGHRDPYSAESLAFVDTTSENWYTADAYGFTGGEQATDDWGETPVNSSYSMVLRIPLSYLSDFFEELPIMFNDTMEITLDMNYGGTSTNSHIYPFQAITGAGADGLTLTVRGGRLYVPVVRLESPEAQIVAENVSKGLKYQMEFTRRTFVNKSAVPAGANNLLVTSSSTRPKKLYLAMYTANACTQADGHALAPGVTAGYIKKSNVKLNGRNMLDEDLEGLRHWDSIKSCMPYYPVDEANVSFRDYLRLYRGLCVYDVEQHKEKISANSANEVRVALTTSAEADVYMTLTEEEVIVITFSSGSTKVVL